MFADRLRIVERGADRPGMQGVEVMLVDVLVGIQFVKGILGFVKSVSVIDIGCTGQIEGEGAVLLFKTVAERKI